jgi:hypothetical protein
MRHECGTTTPSPYRNAQIRNGIKPGTRSAPRLAGVPHRRSRSLGEHGDRHISRLADRWDRGRRTTHLPWRCRTLSVSKSAVPSTSVSFTRRCTTCSPMRLPDRGSTWRRSACFTHHDFSLLISHESHPTPNSPFVPRKQSRGQWCGFQSGSESHVCAPTFVMLLAPRVACMRPDWTQY